MKKVLVIQSSILGESSHSTELSRYFVSKLPQADVTLRDVAAEPIPYYNGAAATATRGNPQTEEHAQLLAFSDNLVSELNAHDVLVIDAPMYNFGVPAQLKTYFDFIARAGVTFRYTSNGPEGLVKGKKAVVILTTGGLHKDTNTDLVRQYVQTFLAFIGIDDVKFVYAEGLAMGAEMLDNAKTKAKAELESIATSL